MKTRQRLESLHSHPLFPFAIRILKRLHDEGFATVFAGGCVRDALLGRAIKDLDLATSASPDRVEQLFARTLAVGKAFGTIVVVEEGHNFEVTTFRAEGPYLDGRHPSRIEFTGMKEDAQRRDFTINALFYDPLEHDVYDFIEGLKDLEAKRLRTVGVAEERFKEDHLRMLRGIRFVAQLGFEVEKDTLYAIQNHRQTLKAVSAERILTEVKRLLEGPYLRKGVPCLLASRLEEVFWPEISTLNIQDLTNFPEFNNWENAFVGLMLLAGAKNFEERLRAWKASRDSIRRVLEMARGLEILLNLSSRRANRARVFGSETAEDVMVLAEGFWRRQKQPSPLESWTKEYLEIADAKGKLPAAFLSGEDLKLLGVQPGAKMGELLKKAYDAQLEGKVRSRKEAEAIVRDLA